MANQKEKLLSVRVSIDDFERIKKLAKERKLAMSKVAYHWIMSGLQIEEKLGNKNIPYSLLSLEDFATQPSPSALPVNQLESILLQLLKMGSASCGYSRRILENTIDDKNRANALIEETRREAENFPDKFKEKIGQ